MLINLVDLNLQVVQILLKNIFFSKIKHRMYFSADCGQGWNFKSFCIALLVKYFEESTWWTPHLLNEEQKCTHVRTARKLFKRFPRYDQKIFMNVVTDDESWIHSFELNR